MEGWPDLLVCHAFKRQAHYAQASLRLWSLEFACFIFTDFSFNGFGNI